METWPKEVRQFLDNNYHDFIGWECEGQGQSSPSQYDQLIYSFRNVLKGFSLLGYHCTKLTREEISAVKSEGMQLQNQNTLSARIDSLQKIGVIDELVAMSLKNNNQSGETDRANMLWFCFFEPNIEGESGIGRFFRSWGGEALYNSHEGNQTTGTLLLQIGVSCVIQASVPMQYMPDNRLPCENFIRSYLKHKGYKIDNAIEAEGYINQPLPASYISDIHEYPSAEFFALTGCEHWRSPITIV
ncbi:MAG: hypothetical protein PF503_07515 [Desulfobacula sp.]|jgi:hypothetical protein|nr:hypothetical protein [Desulfobacula sp.]